MLDKLISSVLKNTERALTAPIKEKKREIKHKTNPHVVAAKISQPITKKINETLKPPKK